MHPLNPVLSSAVLDAMADARIDAAVRAAELPTRRSPLSYLRGRAAARRGGSPIAASGRHVPARAGRA